MFVDEVLFQVPFHDVDIMNVAWHGHYLKYFELARTRLMQSLGLDWPDLRDMGYAMPVTRVNVKYRHSLRYNETYRARAIIEEYEHPALTVHYEILATSSAKVLARGSTQQIYYCLTNGRSVFELPAGIAERFRAKLAPGGTSPCPSENTSIR